VFDMLGPGVDEGDVLTGLHHMRPGISADGTRSDDCDFPAHGFSFSCIRRHDRTGSLTYRLGLDAP
jgi:hypothetical protein